MAHSPTRPALWTRPFTLTTLGMFLLFTPFALYLPVMPVYLLHELHSSMEAAGAVNGVFLLAAVLFRAQTARLEARFGSRRVYLASGFLFVAANLFYLAATTVTEVMLVRFFSGACFAIANTGIQAMGSRLIPRSRTGEGLAYITTMVLAGSAVGPYLGLSLSRSLGYHAVFIVSALVSFLGMLVLCSLNEPDNRPDISPQFSFYGLYERRAVPASLILLMVAVAYGGVLTFVAVYAAELNLSAAAGYFFVAMAVASVAARLLTGRMYDRFGPNAVIYPAILLMAGGLLLLGCARSNGGLLSAAALIGIGYGMAVPAIQTLAIQLSPVHRTSEATATVFTCLDGGVGLGAYVLGGMILALGYARVYGALGLMVLACALLYYAMGRKWKTASAPPCCGHRKGFPMNKPFRYYLRVRYAECDMQRVVFNARYGEYTAVAISEFMRAVGLRREFASGPYGFQWVKQTTEWKAPARFDDVIEASIRTTQVGTTSFTLATEFRLAGEGALLATVESVLVLIDERTMQKTPLLERHRQAITDGAPGTVTDHAGYFQH